MGKTNDDKKAHFIRAKSSNIARVKDGQRRDRSLSLASNSRGINFLRI